MSWIYIIGRKKSRIFDFIFLLFSCSIFTEFSILRLINYQSLVYLVFQEYCMFNNFWTKIWSLQPPFLYFEKLLLVLWLQQFFSGVLFEWVQTFFDTWIFILILFSSIDRHVWFWKILFGRRWDCKIC